MDLLEKDVQDTLSVKPFNVGAHLRLSTPFIPQPNIRPCLFAISNQFGWAIIAIQSFENDQSGPAFILTRVEKLSQSLKNAEPHANTWITSQDAHVTIPMSTFCDPKSVFLTHLAFAASDRLIVAATSDGTLSIFSLQHLISKTDITPLRRLTAHSNIPVEALIPNPAPGGSFSALIAVVYGDSTIRVLDLYDAHKIHWEAQSITAAEWSPMGKRLIVGYKDGKLEYFTHEGQSKGVIEAPTQAESMEVLHIRWIDQKDYIITFCERVAKEGSDELATQTFALHVKKQTTPIDYSFRLCPDPTPAQGVLDTSPNRLMTRLPTCSPATWRHLIIVSLSNSTELGIIGFEDAQEPSLLILSEDHRLEIPSSEESYEPASPLGVAATFSTTTSSIIWSYTTDGVLSLWNTQLSAPEGQGDPPAWVDPAIDQKVLSMDSGIDSPPADQTKSPSSNPPDRNSAPQQQTTACGPSASASSAFSSSQAAPVSSFGQPSKGTTPFGQTASGQQSAFGQSASGQSAFGTQSQSASTSVFGTGHATFGPPAPTSTVAPTRTSFSSSQTAFGPSAFGTKPLSASTSAFGTTQTSFGQPASTITALTASTPFSGGQTAFGHSGFGSSAFGQSAFGTKSLTANTSVFGTGHTTQPGSTSTVAPASTPFSSSTTPVGFAAFANPASTKTSQETGSNSTLGFAQFNNGSSSLQLGAGLLPGSSFGVSNIFGASTSTSSSTTNIPRDNAVPSAVWGASDNNSSTPQRPSFATPIGSFSGNSTLNSPLSFAAVSAPKNTVSFTQLRGSSTSPPHTKAEVTETTTTPKSPVIPSSQNIATEDGSAQELASAIPDEPTEISLSGLQFGNSTPLGSFDQTTFNTEEIADSGSEQGGPESTTSSIITSPEQNVASEVPKPSSPDVSIAISLSALQVDSSSILASSERSEMSQTIGDETEESRPAAVQEVAQVSKISPSISTTSNVGTGDISGGAEPTISSEATSDERDAPATNDDPTSLSPTPASSKVSATFGSPSRKELLIPSTPPPASPRSPQTTAETQELGASTSRGIEQFSNSGSSFSTPSKGKTGSIFAGSTPTSPSENASDEENAVATNDDQTTLPESSSSSKVPNTCGSPLRNEISLPATLLPASPRSPQNTTEAPKLEASASRGFEQFSKSGSTFSTPSKGDTADIFGRPSPTSPSAIASNDGNGASTTSASIGTPPGSSSKVFATSSLRNDLSFAFTPNPASSQSPQSTAGSQGLGASGSRGFGQFSNSESSSSTPFKGKTADIFSGRAPTFPTETDSDKGDAASATNAIMGTPPATPSSSKAFATSGSSLRNELSLPSTPNSTSLQSPQATAVTPGLGASVSRGFGQFSKSESSFSTPSKGDTGNIFGGPTERNAVTTKHNSNSFAGSPSSFKAPNTFNSPSGNGLSFSQPRGSPRSLEGNRADAVPSTSITPSPGINAPLSDSGSEHSSATGSDKSWIDKSTSSCLPGGGSAFVTDPELKEIANDAKDGSVGLSGPVPSSSQIPTGQILTSMASAELEDKNKAAPSTAPLATGSIASDSRGLGSKYLPTSVTAYKAPLLDSPSDQPRVSSQSQQSLQNINGKLVKTETVTSAKTTASAPIVSALSGNRSPRLDNISSGGSKTCLAEKTNVLHASSTSLSRSISDPSGIVLSASSSSLVRQSVSLPTLLEGSAGLERPQKPDLCGSISGQLKGLRDQQGQCDPKTSLFNSPGGANSQSLLANAKLPGAAGINLPKLVSQENGGPSAVMQTRTIGGPSSPFVSPVKVASQSDTKAPPPHDPKLPFSTQPAVVSLPITSLDHTLVPKIIASSEPETLPSIEVGIEQAILRVVDISSSTLQSLASVCHTCQCYIEGCKVPLRTHDSTTDQHTLKQWQMADLPTLSRHVNSLTEQAQIEIARLDSRFQNVRTLESGVSKAELKHEEVKRILRAYNDPGYFRVLGSRQLSPVQLARQKSMRRSFQDIKLGAGQVSVALESLRSRLVGIKAGRRQMQPPFLDTINRSVHQLTQALSHHILHIHHLSSRLRALQAAQSKTNQSSLELVPHSNSGSSIHEQNQAFMESAALQALQSEHTGVRFRDAILDQRSRPVLTLPQESNSTEESALSLILPAEPIIIKPRKASSPPKSSLSYECRSPTWFHSPRLSHGRLSEGQSTSSPPLISGSGKAGQWFGSEQTTGKSGGWMRGSR